MPKRVDHEEWRARVADTAAELIAEGGLAAMTFRRLADRLGCSTTVISHYFADRSQLLHSVYDATNAEAAAVRDSSLQSKTPIHAFGELLPVNRRRARTWRIWLTFWNSALFDDALREKHRRGLAGTRRMLRSYLLSVGVADEAAERGAAEIMQAMFGIAMQALFDSDYWYPGRQLAAYRAVVDRVVPRAAPASPPLAEPITV